MSDMIGWLRKDNRITFLGGYRNFINESFIFHALFFKQTIQVFTKCEILQLNDSDFAKYAKNGYTY